MASKYWFPEAQRAMQTISPKDSSTSACPHTSTLCPLTAAMCPYTSSSFPPIPASQPAKTKTSLVRQDGKVTAVVTTTVRTVKVPEEFQHDPTLLSVSRSVDANGQVVEVRTYKPFNEVTDLVVHSKI